MASDLSEQLEQAIGVGVGVEKTEKLPEEDYTRYGIKCNPDYIDMVENRLIELEDQGFETDGESRDVELRRGANNRPISGMPYSFFLHIEDRESELEASYGGSQ